MGGVKLQLCIENKVENVFKPKSDFPSEVEHFKEVFYFQGHILIRC